MPLYFFVQIYVLTLHFLCNNHNMNQSDHHYFLVYNYVNKLKNCLYTYVQLYGVTSLLDVASSPMDVFPLKYSMLILQHQRSLNDGWEDII